MITEWRKFKGWLILEYFLRKPNTKTYIKQLSRELNISPRTTEIYLKGYNECDILSKEVVGNLHLYRLNNDDFLVKELKKIFILSKLKETVKKIIIEINPVSIAVYGSVATGTYSEKSDIDILIITLEKTHLKKTKVPSLLREVKEKTGLNVEAVLFNIKEWRRLKQREFGKEIIHNHIILYGASL